MEEVAARQEDGAPGKKKRKKKKKAKGAVEGVEAESEEPPFNQKPPKIEVITKIVLNAFQIKSNL